MDKRLLDQVAVVTGASSGIGRATALLFAKHGAKVMCLDVQPQSCMPEESPPTVDKIRADGGLAAYFEVDVSDSGTVNAVIKKIVEEFTTIHILVNCAGIFIRNSVVDVKDAEWERVLGINLSGYFYTCRAALPYMVENKGGKIVNISSIHGIRGTGAATTYCTSKGGVENLTKQLAAEYAPLNIRVNAVTPGTIRTAMCKPFLETPKYLAEYEKRTLLPRLGVPEDVANCALFLASDESSYVVGHSLVVDGGWTIT